MFGNKQIAEASMPTMLVQVNFKPPPLNIPLGLQYKRPEKIRKSDGTFRFL